MTILIVEDHPEVARLMADALQAEGFTVIVVQTGDEALRRLTKGAVDCVVIDHVLPLQNGIEIIRAARASQPTLPMILVASALLPDVERDARRAGAFGCLAKHLNFLPSLVRMVRDALGGRFFRIIRPALVGRDVQIGAIGEALATARGGYGQLLCVLGEDGLGKTTLLRRAAVDARALGMLTLVARCDAERVPYAPWFAIHRAYAAATHRTTSIDDIVSELAAAPETWNVPLAQAQRAKTGRFERVAQCLHDIAAEQPLLVILDDLHLADSGSVEFLAYLAEQLPRAPFAILCAYDPTDSPATNAVTSHLATIGGEHDALILHLGAFTASDIRRYVEESIGKDLGTEFASAMFEKTDGHPQLVAGLLRLAIAEHHGETTLSSDILANLPASRLAAIDRQLGKLSEGAQEWLVVAALAGRQFDAQLVLDAAGDDRAAAEAALDEARRMGVLIVDEESGEDRFHSEITREAVAGRASRAERARCHAVLGRAIERRCGHDLDPWLPVLARHFVHAGWERDPNIGIDYACRAGDRLGRLLAWAEAAGFYEDALQLDDRWRVLPAAGRLSVWNRLAEARWRAGRFPAAREAGRQALESADPTNDPEAYLAAVLNFAGALPGYGAIVREPEVVRVLEDALRRTVDRPGSIRPVVMARFADEVAFAEQGQRAGKLVAAAHEAAKNGKSLPVEAATLRQSQWAMWTLSPPEHDSRLREMADLAEATGDAVLRLDVDLMRVLSAHKAGDVILARRILTGCIQDAEALRLPYGLWVAKVTEANLAISTGHFDEGIQLAGDAVALGKACGNPNAELFSAVQCGHVFWLRGHFDAGLAWLETVGADVPALGFAVHMSRGITLCEAGRLDEARAVVESLGRKPLARLPRDVTWMMNASYLGEIAARTGMRRVATDVLKALTPLAGYNVILPPLFGYVPVAHILGIIAASQGTTRVAREWFRHAVEMEQRSQAPHWLARTKVEQATMLVRLGQRAEATAIVDEARALIEKLGLASLDSRIGELATTCRTPAAAERRMRHCIFRRLLPKSFEVGLMPEEPSRLDLTDGFRYLWELIRCADKLVDVCVLYAAIHGGQRLYDGGTATSLDLSGKRHLRDWLSDLNKARIEAEEAHDQAAIDRIDAEYEAIERELDSGDKPLGGADPRTKRQQTVRQAIKLALDRLRAHEKPFVRELGDFLAHQIRTGFTCMFVSHPDWVFEL